MSADDVFTTITACPEAVATIICNLLRRDGRTYLSLSPRGMLLTDTAGKGGLFSADRLKATETFRPGLICVDLSLTESLSLCEHWRREGIRNPILQVGESHDAEVARIQAVKWDGSAQLLTGLAESPPFLTRSDITSKVLPYIEKNLTHDLRKWWTQPPTTNLDDLLVLVRDRCDKSLYHRSMLNGYLQQFGDMRDALRSLAKLVWREYDLEN